MASGRREILGDDLEAVVAGYRNGLSLAALGREYSCTPLKVKKALQGAGVEIRTAKPTARQAQVASQPSTDGTDDTSSATRETENFVVEEPPRPKKAPVDKLDKKRDRSRAKAARLADDAPSGGAGRAGREATTIDEAELEDGLAAFEAGVDDEGHVDRILALAAKLRRKGKLSARQYKTLVNSVLDPDDEPLREVQPHPGGKDRRTGGRSLPGNQGLQGPSVEEGGSQLQGVAEPQDPRVRPSGHHQRPPVNENQRVNALSAVLAGYRGR